MRRQLLLALIFCYLSALHALTTIQHAVVVAALIFLMCFATLYSPKALQLKALVFFGTISYAIYLVHNNIGTIVLRAVYAHGLSPSVAITCASLIAIGIATILTFCVEKPAMDVLRRFAPSLQRRVQN